MERPARPEPVEKPLRPFARGWPTAPGRELGSTRDASESIADTKRGTVDRELTAQPWPGFDPLHNAASRHFTVLFTKGESCPKLGLWATAAMPAEDKQP